MTPLTDSNKGRHTIPWTDDEYMLVNGRKMIYTVAREPRRITVHLPGRVSIPLKKLKAQGFSVIMPKNLREWDYC